MLGLQVFDAMLWKCWQTTDGLIVISVLLEEHSMAELVFDVLYNIHHPTLLEFERNYFQQN